MHVSLHSGEPFPYLCNFLLNSSSHLAIRVNTIFRMLKYTALTSAEEIALFLLSLRFLAEEIKPL